MSALDLSGYDTDAGATVMAGTYSTDDVPAALASALEDYSGTTMGDTGDTVTVGGYTFTCVTGPCSVSVSDDERARDGRGHDQRGGRHDDAAGADA